MIDLFQTSGTSPTSTIESSRPSDSPQSVSNRKGFATNDITSEVTFSSTPVNAMPVFRVADTTTPLNATNKRNRGGRCRNLDIHGAHDTCPGRERRGKIARPVTADVAGAVNAAWHLGMLQVSKLDKDAVGVISKENRELYNLELEGYENVSEAISGKDEETQEARKTRKDTFIAFFTTLKRANDIILDYAKQDLLPLTLRQIHYQMVVRHKDYPNNKDSYRHMCEHLVAGRMSGFVPWNAIDDPSRGLHSGWSTISIQQLISGIAETYRMSRWQNQQKWPLLLVEKDAAFGIISRACNDFDVPYVSLKGYGSVTALRNIVAAHCLQVFNDRKEPVIIHLSDLDASGWDMGRNLVAYLNKMVRRTVDVRHIALTLEQVAQIESSPDPVKLTDPRAKKFIEWQTKQGLIRDGEPGAWEMDALRPDVLHDIIVNEIESCRDIDLWQEVEDAETAARQKIQDIAEHMSDPLPSVGEMA